MQPKDRARSRTSEYHERAKRVIPGVSQLLSKRPDQFAPDAWPGYFSKAQGAYVWDLDDNRYLDMSISGIGANVLGYCDPEVDGRVIETIRSGNSSSLNCPEEVELAELLCEIHPWAQMARFARTGGESMAIAVRIARAHTRRDKVAFSGYHGWQDWYLAANLAEDTALDGHLLPGLAPTGVPRGLQGTSFPFRYNEISDLREIVRKHGKDLAAIVMEPIRNADPAPGFIEEVRAIASEIGAVLIFDEISSGFRLLSGGAHLKFSIRPDMAVFAKAMSNGYPMAAILGTSKVMSSAQDTFISSTYWTERVGPAAALATIKKHRRENVSEHLIRMGSAVQAGWKAAAQENDLKVQVSGIFPMSYLKFDYPNGQIMSTVFVQEMLKAGFLASGRFYSTYAHTQEMVDSYLAQVRGVFAKLSSAQAENRLEALLEGSVARPGFHRIT